MSAQVINTPTLHGLILVNERGNEIAVTTHEGYTIILSCEPEHVSIESALGFEATGTKAHASTIRKVKKGKWVHVCVKLAVCFDGEEKGVSYLGSCVDVDFKTMLESDIHGYLPQMIEEAIEEARA